MSMLARAVAGIAKNYAVYGEPLVFFFRRSSRLRLFGKTLSSAIPEARLIPEAGACDGAGPGCQAFARRYARYFGKFQLQEECGMSPMHASGLLAAIDLGSYGTYEAYRVQLSRASGNFLRGAKKAARLGYITKVFAYPNHTPDICAIRRSRSVRAFGPVLDAFLLTVDDIGGPPQHYVSVATPACPYHWELFFGVFQPAPGYCQGNLAVGEHLVGYAKLHRSGNVVRLADFMGHGAHMSHGVMMLLQDAIMQWLLNSGNPLSDGVRYLAYGAIEQGRSGLAFWKKKALFEPHLVRIGAP